MENRKLQGLLAAEQAGAATHAARHLGGQYCRTQSNAPEMEKRRIAMQAAWCEMGVFWYSKISRACRREALIANVISAGLAGNSSYRLLPSKTKFLDKLVVSKLRSMMGGAAFDCENKKKMSNTEVLSAWRLLPMRLEIAVRNVKWLQCMVEHPEAHVQVLGSVFGRVVFGKSVEHNNLNNEGKPAEPVNPFTQRLLSRY